MLLSKFYRNANHATRGCVSIIDKWQSVKTMIVHSLWNFKWQQISLKALPSFFNLKLRQKYRNPLKSTVRYIYLKGKRNVKVFLRTLSNIGIIGEYRWKSTYVKEKKMNNMVFLLTLQLFLFYTIKSDCIMSAFHIHQSKNMISCELKQISINRKDQNVL